MKGNEGKVEELQKHVDAFEQYFQLTQNGRSPNAAFEEMCEMGVGGSVTLLRWSKKFKWGERAAIRAGGINSEVEREINSTIVDNKVRYLSFYHRFLDDLEDDFDIKIWNVTDLKKVFDGCLVLQSEASKHVTEDSHCELSIDERIKERAEHYQRLNSGTGQSD